MTIDGDHISEISEGKSGESDLLIVPGLVDIHCHGAEGLAFNSPLADSWIKIRRSHLRHGTATILPTIATAPFKEIAAALDIGRTLLAAEEPGIAGLHLEGPFISKSFRGAHSLDLVHDEIPPVLDPPFDNLDGIRILTFAPELPGANTLLAACLENRVTPAAGHTAATPDELVRAKQSGLAHVTHLWSGHSRLKQNGPVRVPGLLEAALSSDELTAEAITDGHHLTAEMAMIAYRCFGPDRLCLVSDASPGTGLYDGATFSLGGGTASVHDGVAWSADGTSYSGSVSYLLDIVRFAVKRAGIGLVDAIRMATTTPARVAGLETGTGEVIEGGQATFLLLHPNLSLAGVFKGGKQIV